MNYIFLAGKCPGVDSSGTRTSILLVGFVLKFLEAFYVVMNKIYNFDLGAHETKSCESFARENKTGE